MEQWSETTPQFSIRIFRQGDLGYPRGKRNVDYAVIDTHLSAVVLSDSSSGDWDAEPTARWASRFAPTLLANSTVKILPNCTSSTFDLLMKEMMEEESKVISNKLDEMNIKVLADGYCYGALPILVLALIGNSIWLCGGPCSAFQLRENQIINIHPPKSLNLLKITSERWRNVCDQYYALGYAQEISPVPQSFLRFSGPWLIMPDDRLFLFSSDAAELLIPYESYLEPEVTHLLAKQFHESSISKILELSQELPDYKLTDRELTIVEVLFS